MITVPVEVPGRAYQVHVGRRLPAARLLGEALGQGARRRTHVVADARVLRLHGAPRGASLHEPIPVAPGERSKSMGMAERIVSELARRGAGRDAVVLALGGGMVSDLAGFAASLHARGVALAIVPTTLLGMVDAAVGGKTAVNLPEGKNLVGTFHQPRIVLADTAYLRTLPPRDLRSGWAEIVKAALLQGGEPWDDVASRGGDFAAMPSHETEPFVARAVAFKGAVVAEDEREQGRRALLNLGHTLGHALEAATGYRHYRHGEAVAVGLIFAAELSRRVLDLPDGEVERIRRVVLPLGRGRPPGGLGLDDLDPYLARDKKARSSRPRWVLLEAPGRARLVGDVPRSVLRASFAVLGRYGLA